MDENQDKAQYNGRRTNNATVAIDPKTNRKLDVLCQDYNTNKKDFLSAAVIYFWNNGIDPRFANSIKTPNDTYKTMADMAQMIKEQHELLQATKADTQWAVGALQEMQKRAKHWWSRLF